MVRQPCCDKGVKKGAWTPEEDRILVDYITKNGHGTWRKLPEKAGLLRCGKSCRLRYINYLRSDIKRGPFTPEEVTTIIRLHGVLGNRWAYIASQLEGRTDNEIKNFWNTHLKKQLPATNQLTSQSPFSSSKTLDLTSESSSTSHVVQCESAKAITSVHAFPSPEVKPCSDYIPNLWNSEVREPFGKIKDETGVTIQQPKKETASPSKVESESVITTQAESAGTTLTLPDTADKEKEMLPATSKNEKDMAALNSSQSYDLDMDLLLDIPGCNYLDFLRETYGVSFY